MPKILIFEDEKMLADMYATKFRLEGIEAVVQYDGRDPVRLAVKEKPDIISMDIIMPKINGFDAVKLLKADPRTKDIPVYFLSSLGQVSDIVMGKSLGAVEYFVKANHLPSEIVSFVKEVLGLPHQVIETIPERVKKGRRWLDRLLGKK